MRWRASAGVIPNFRKLLDGGPKSKACCARPAPTPRGASADRHETWVQDAMDANALSDVQCESGRQRRVGPAPQWQVPSLRF
jgi:hypothetical protein